MLEEERLTAEERARRQLLEERARIARELHDVVAHHMSVIVVQASTAAYRIEGMPEAARKEFTGIAESARASLAEMRRLLAVLRSDDHDPVPPGERVESRDGAGHGLVGMRERVTAAGGRLRAGPTAEGGFLVEALLPLQPVEAAP